MPEGQPGMYGEAPKFTEKATPVDPREWDDFVGDHRVRKQEIFGRDISELDTEVRPEPEQAMLTREQLDSLDGHDPEEQQMIERYKRQNLENAA